MTTPLVSFSGIASGLDTNSIVEQLVTLERRPIQLAQERQSDLNRVSGRLGNIRSQLEGLKSATEGLDDTDDVLVTRATSSDEDTVSVSTDGAAPAGAYSLEVTALAQAERTYSDAFASNNVALNDATMLGGTFTGGTLSVQVGSATTVDITLEASDTLETLVSKINSSDADVTAGLLYDGTNYRLQVSGNETGAENGITFTETGAGLDLGFTDPANERVAAQDAEFSFDGFAMTRSTNNISDVLDGLTFQLFDTTTSPVTIDISQDTEALEGQVQAFVDSYNQITRSINAEFAFSGEARIGDSLSGDSTLRGLQARMRSLAGSVIDELSAPYNRLGGAGISFEQDGTLTVDAAELKEALADDPDALSKLFIDDNFTGVEGFMPRFAALVDEYTQSGTGILTSRIDSIGRQVSDIDDSIARMEQRVLDYEENLRRQFTAMEEAISNLNAQGGQLTAILGGLA